MMHDTANEIGKKVLSLYAGEGSIIVEFGSYDFNGTLRSFAPQYSLYLGLDVEHGPSVDLTVEVGKPVPLKSEFADLVISSSQLEHDPFFWDTFLELVRITKDGGIIYINVPSNGPFHRYPKDYWRLYPDAGLALAEWASRKGFAVELIESFILDRKTDIWNDFVMLFIKSRPEDRQFQFIADGEVCSNVHRIGTSEIQNMVPYPEDMRLISDLRATIKALEARIEGSSSSQADCSDPD